jgi:hypothetical protein
LLSSYLSASINPAPFYEQADFRTETQATLSFTADGRYRVRGDAKGSHRRRELLVPGAERDRGFARRRTLSDSGNPRIVRGGSLARCRARADSDVDLGLLYDEQASFEIEALRTVAARLNDHPEPVVIAFYEWGRWVNGGAWLTIRGQRVDLLYRSLQHLEQVITNADRGRYEIDYEQQPPFGFLGPTCLGEISICEPLFDQTVTCLG